MLAPNTLAGAPTSTLFSVVTQLTQRNAHHSWRWIYPSSSMPCSSMPAHMKKSRPPLFLPVWRIRKWRNERLGIVLVSMGHAATDIGWSERLRSSACTRSVVQARPSLQAWSCQLRSLTQLLVLSDRRA